MNKLPLLLILILIAVQGVSAAQVDVHVFYGKGCPHCEQAMAFFEGLDDPEVRLFTYEVYFDQENRVMLEQLAKTYNTTISGVPTMFIGDQVFVGFDNTLQEELQKKILSCEQTPCQDPLEKITATSTVVDKLTIPAVISAAAVDAINPCAFAVLIILITTILASKHRKRTLFAGLAFSASIFISYFLMGIGLYSAIGAAGIGHTFFIIVSILAILIGIFNLKDYLWYGKWFVMEVPLSWRPRLKAVIKRVTSVPGAFITGFVVSLFLLPCTSGPYIVILGLLSQIASRQYAMSLLLLYNFIFIIPMLLITLAIYCGITTTERAEEWRTKRLQSLHLIAGIILILLGMGMIGAMLLGMM